MKAIRIHKDGGPEVLHYEDAPEPKAGPGDVLIELRAASLNHLDVWIRRGSPSVPKPRILGSDGAGVVVRGDGFEPGRRVVINPGIELGNGHIPAVGQNSDGTYAERIAVPREQVYAIPDALSYEAAAAFPLVFETAYRMLVTKAHLAADEWVLVWGIGSGVSTATLSIAKALGAHVIVTSSSPSKLERAKDLGADAAFNHETDEIVAAVNELARGGAHVVVDHVGEATWTKSLNAARPEGRMCVCGATSGKDPPASLHRIWWKQLTVYGSTMGTRDDFAAVYELVTSGKVTPVVDEIFPLSEGQRGLLHRQPVWSPDGNALIAPAFVERNPHDFIGSLYLLPAAGGPARLLGPGGYGSFSADGRYVAYQTSEEPYGGGWDRVGVYRLDGTQPARSFGRGVNPSWSPRTDRLAFVQLPRPDRAVLTRYRAGVLTVVDANGRHRWVLPGPPIWSSAWSPDGLSIAFVRKPYAPTIFLVRPGSKKVCHVIVLPRSFGDRCCNAYAYTLSWSADGRWLAATGEAGTFFVRPTGTGFQGGPRVEFLTWAPRGATAAFVELSALGVRQLERWPGSRGLSNPQFAQCSGVSWSRGGSRVVFARGIVSP